MALDPAKLCLHKEGIFYKLYNQDAMRFTDNIRPLKITGRFIKTVNDHVYSAGFPATLLDTVTRQLVAHGGVVADAGELITVSGVAWEKENDYAQWCENQNVGWGEPVNPNNQTMRSTLGFVPHPNLR